MTALQKQKMNLAEFLDWAQHSEGKYELVRGEVFAMAPGNLHHARAKLATVNALSAAIKRAGKPCEALIDGPGVALGDESCYIPNVSVYCGERAPGTFLLVPDPMIVVEVLSPSSERLDKAGKLADYFSIPSIAHYLIIDLKRRHVIHHSRGEGGIIPTRIVTEGDIVLDPPGITIAMAGTFGD